MTGRHRYYPSLPPAVRKARAALFRYARDGNEHYLLYDGSDRLICRETSGLKDFVGVKNPLARARLHDDAADLKFHHNHPRSSTLSGPDFEFFLECRGIHEFWAHGHNGASHRISRTAMSSRLTNEVISVHCERAHVALRRLMRMGKVPENVSQRYCSHIWLTSLSREGYFDYTVYEFPDDSLWELHKELVILALFKAGRRRHRA